MKAGHAILILVVGSLGFFAFMIYMGVTDDDPRIVTRSRVKGAVEIAGAKGSRRIKPRFCLTGSAALGFKGAKLYANHPSKGKLKNKGVITVRWVDKDAHKVELELPGTCRPPKRTYCTKITLDRKSCETFHVEVRDTGKHKPGRIRGALIYEGDARFVCTKKGVTYRGDVSFHHCD